MAAAYDGSPRFLQYVLSHPGVASYAAFQRRKLAGDGVFLYKCNLKSKDYMSLFERPLVPHAPVEVPPPRIMKPKKLVPPALSTSQQRRLARALADPSVHFVLLPMLLVSNAKECVGFPANHRRHVLAVLVNKHAHRLEVLDPYLVNSMRSFHVSRFLTLPFADMLLPKLKTLGLDLADSIDLPRFDERHYEAMLRGLAARGYPANNYVTHAAFTANYLAARVADPTATSAAISAGVMTIMQKDPKAFFERYEAWRVFQARPGPEGCPQDGIRNPETSRCVLPGGPVGRKVLGVEPACVASKVRNPLTRRCMSARRVAPDAAAGVQLQEHFVSAHAGDDYLAFEIGAQDVLAMRYILERYGPIVAMSSINFLWKHSVKAGKHALTPPKDFVRVWDAGMRDDAVRFVAFNVFLSSPTVIESHANMLIYDKHTRELERFEPNGAIPMKALDNGENMDAAIVAAFGKRIGSYAPPLLVCPRGFQEEDIREHNQGAKDIGGNCAVWSLYYLELRLGNPHLSREKVVKTALRAIWDRGSFAMFINGYHRFVEKEMLRLKDADKK